MRGGRRALGLSQKSRFGNRSGQRSVGSGGAEQSYALRHGCTRLIKEYKNEYSAADVGHVSQLYLQPGSFVDVHNFEPETVLGVKRGRVLLRMPLW